jgi:SAM-dependent methyltransferase
VTAKPVFDGAYADRQLRRSRNTLRRAIKRFYLNNLLREVRGRAVDLGFGAGQLLRRLPPGSLGLEVNPHLVDAARREGLNAQLYDADAEQPLVGTVPANTYSTLVMAHVLEHFTDADLLVRKILRSCASLGINRVVFVVPGAKGYDFDSTHRTFVNVAYLKERNLLACEGYAVTTRRYFPGNREWIGRHYTFHEFLFVYDRVA